MRNIKLEKKQMVSMHPQQNNLFCKNTKKISASQANKTRRRRLTPLTPTLNQIRSAVRDAVYPSRVAQFHNNITKLSRRRIIFIFVENSIVFKMPNRVRQVMFLARFRRQVAREIVGRRRPAEAAQKP
jgi:hypothetical protein